MERQIAKSTPAELEKRLHRAIWRWHFYAGIFCIPFVVWLACTGSIYLFSPQIERWVDRPYDHLNLSGQKATPAQIAAAAVAAVPGSVLHYYQLPPGSDAATRVEVGVGDREFRVYVNPVTRRILHVANEDDRPMVLLAHLHGQLLMGNWGSYLMELVASWALVLLLTGLYLWWPRQAASLAGVLWVRTRKGKRLFWRDLHAVTGIWVSAFALFLITTGLPWAAGWGTYFEKIREITGTAAVQEDWTHGRASELAQRAARGGNVLNPAEDMPAMHHAIRTLARQAYTPFNRLVPVAASLHLAAPVQIFPAAMPGGPWTIQSDSENRTLRNKAQVDPLTGALVGRENFSQRMLLDRITDVGISVHEGQLFGLANQLLGLATAAGLVTLCVGAVVLWWRRRHVGVLGAPIPIGRPRWGIGLALIVLALALYLPAMAISLLLVFLAERWVLARIPALRRWLGLAA